MIKKNWTQYFSEKFGDWIWEFNFFYWLIKTYFFSYFIIITVILLTVILVILIRVVVPRIKIEQLAKNGWFSTTTILFIILLFLLTGLALYY